MKQAYKRTGRTDLGDQKFRWKHQRRLHHLGRPVSHQSVTRELGIPLQRAVMETAEGSVYNVLSGLGTVSNKDLVDYILEAFSDIPTQEDAMDKLRTLKRKNEALIAFNATYTAIHRRAFHCKPHSQVRESVWREYANTLDRDFAASLNYQIGRQKGIQLHTLEDVMEKQKTWKYRKGKTRHTNTGKRWMTAQSRLPK